MTFLGASSHVAIKRGYNYYIKDKVISWNQISESEITGRVRGSQPRKIYSVVLDLDHPRKSKCNCPHAKGNMTICKHKVAVYFSSHPEEVEPCMEKEQPYWDAKAQKEAERRKEKYEEWRICVEKIPYGELRDGLLSAMIELDGRNLHLRAFTDLRAKYCDKWWYI